MCTKNEPVMFVERDENTITLIQGDTTMTVKKSLLFNLVDTLRGYVNPYPYDQDSYEWEDVDIEELMNSTDEQPLDDKTLGELGL